MRSPLIVVAGLAAALLATPSLAHDFKTGSLEIGHPYAIESTGKTAAGYFSVTNAGTTDDRLMEIRADVPRADVHATETDASGVTRMTPVGPLDVPPGETVTLEPGGLHVMFMGLENPLKAGDTLPATLVFEKAGEIAVEFQVQPRGEAAEGAATGGAGDGAGDDAADDAGADGGSHATH